MHYEGKIYRPWTEANSVLIQTTLGCSNNQCTFCSMFDNKRFRGREIAHNPVTKQNVIQTFTW